MAIFWLITNVYDIGFFYIILVILLPGLTIKDSNFKNADPFQSPTTNQKRVKLYNSRRQAFVRMNGSTIDVEGDEKDEYGKLRHPQYLGGGI